MELLAFYRVAANDNRERLFSHAAVDCNHNGVLTGGEFQRLQIPNWSWLGIHPGIDPFSWQFDLGGSLAWQADHESRERCRRRLTVLLEFVKFVEFDSAVDFRGQGPPLHCRVVTGSGVGAGSIQSPVGFVGVNQRLERSHDRFGRNGELGNTSERRQKSYQIDQFCLRQRIQRDLRASMNCLVSPARSRRLQSGLLSRRQAAGELPRRYGRSRFR